MDVSIVIGFKDWGLDRLTLSVESLKESIGSFRGEIIVSDYGSADEAGNRRIVEATGARYIYTTTDGVWSRSRALNAGVAASSGRIIVTTDADMLFSPTSISTIVAELQQDPSQAMVLQCRDLPSTFTSEGVLARGLDWDEFESVSRFRPRWGMGGMMAVHRDAYLDVRGFDERMQVYGGEDIDFATRVRRSGRRLRWVEDDRVRMYHMWHPSSREESRKSQASEAAVRRNSDILLHDKSYIRNTTSWRHKPLDARVLASVVICTRNRSEYLADSIYSALAQTVRDIEVIVVDDGSDDGTEELVRGINDTRLRYIRQDHKGLAAGRNLAARESRGAFTVIHDDDDIMFPNRIEKHFAALEGGIQGTYGGWIDFANENPRDYKAHAGKEFKSDMVRFVGGVYLHPTLMLETRLILEVPYDESLRSGSDYSLGIRLMRSGVQLKHAGSHMILRRLHPRQVTHADSAFQKSSWSFTKTMGLQNLSPAQVKFMKNEMDSEPVSIGKPGDLWKFMSTSLPDGVADRSAVISLSFGASVPQEILTSDRFNATIVKSLDDQIVAVAGVLAGVTHREMYLLSAANIDYSLDFASENEKASIRSSRVDNALIGRELRRRTGTGCVLAAVETDAPLAVTPMPAKLVDTFNMQRPGSETWLSIFEFDSFANALGFSKAVEMSNASSISFGSARSLVDIH